MPISNNNQILSGIKSVSPVLKHDDESTSLSSKMTSVSNHGVDGDFPLMKSHLFEEKKEICDNGVDLHRNNRGQQATTIKLLLEGHGHKNISEKMITTAMALGHGGDIQGQELQYRPENGLIILSLLDKTEVTPTLLSCAAKLIKQTAESPTDKNIKQILKKEQTKFDKQIIKLFNEKKEELTQRFFEKNVKPAITNILKLSLPESTINRYSIEFFLDAGLNDKKNELIESEMQSYSDFKDDNFVDKYQQINNIFSALEEKIEIIKPSIVDSQTETPSTTLEAKPEETVAGGANPAVLAQKTPATEPKSVINNYYITHNYNMSKDIASINNIDAKTGQVENHQSDNRTVERDDNQSHEMIEDAVGPSTRFKALPEMQNANRDQPISQKENELRENAPKEVTLSAEELQQKIVRGARMSAGELSADVPSVSIEAKQSEEVNVFLPRTNRFANRFKSLEVVDEVTGKTKKSWLPVTAEAAPVTLTTQGVLTRDQAEKERYGKEPIASGTEKMGIPNNPNTVANRFKSVEIADEVTGKTKKSWQPATPEVAPVTLTTQGALTRDQAEKERYGKGPIASGTEKMGIPNNTHTFSNQFKPAKIVDEATGKTKTTWRLSDEKTSQSVTLTEMGALTRNQADKERYNDNTTRSEKG
ncbi:hypothetical protein [Providencia sp. PROV130]|uniref:hypothetical protein n=1 Tax=Providencia sp. PROV130 TaxID=2949840 RepID=UPI00234B6583|nr:hypothetical protein [Providencia sp. PROV130]